MEYNYKIMLHKEPEGGFTVSVPTLSGCITYGENIDEALSLVKEAVTLYVEELKEKDEPITDDCNNFGYSLRLNA